MPVAPQGVCLMEGHALINEIQCALIGNNYVIGMWSVLLCS